MARTFENIRVGISRDAGSLTFKQGQLSWESKRGSGAKNIAAGDIKSIEWCEVDCMNRMMKITFKDKSKPHFRFVGFGNESELEIDKLCNDMLGTKLAAKNVALKGSNWGRFVLRAQEMVCRTENKHVMFTIPYGTLNQSVIQGRNEISFEFKTDQTSSKNMRGDQLLEMRIFIPDDEQGVGESGAAYEEFNDTLIKKAGLAQDKSQIIAWFEKIYFKLPRGRYQIQFYPNHFLFRGDTFSYKITYKQIKKLFMFQLPDGKMALLVSLSPPIRQGQTQYGYLIMEFPNDENCSTNINATEQELKTTYASRDGQQLLHPTTEGPTYDVLSRVFISLAKIKIIAPKNFKSSHDDHCVRCSLGAYQGLLFPLEKSMFFIWKPATYVKHTDIDHVEFARINEGHQAKMFDLVIHVRKGEKKLVFTGIDKPEYEKLVEYFLAKDNVNIADKSYHINQMQQSMKGTSRSTRTRKSLKMASAALNVEFAADEDEDEDEDYDMNMDAGQLDQDDDDDDDYHHLTDEKNLDRLDDANLIADDDE